MDVVIRTPHGEAEIRIGAHDRATRLVDVLEVVTGRAVPPVVEVDARAVAAATPLDDAGVLEGSVIDVGDREVDLQSGAVVELVQVAGWGTASRAALRPGTYRIGPGRRVNAAELAHAPVDRVGFELHVGPDGSVTVTAPAGAPEPQERVRVDGRPVAPGATVSWEGGVLDALGRAFELAAPAPGPPHRPRPDHGSATATFNRPPLASPPPPATLPLAGAVDPRLHVRPHARRGSRSRTVVDERRDEERDRLRSAHVLPSQAPAVASAAGAQLWSERHAPTEPIELVVGLGDVPWRPPGVEGDHGSLPMVPVTVDLTREQGLALVGSTDFVRAVARGVLTAAAVSRGPADLTIVVATHADRLGAWEWVKWLPHCRTAGTIDVLTSAEAVAAVVDPSARPGPLVLVVTDEPAWWRERAAPLRPLLAGARSPIRLLALVAEAAIAPTVCTTLLTERDDVAVLDRLLDRERLDDVHPFAVTSDLAATTARHLAGLDDPDLPPPGDDPSHRRAPVLDLLALAADTGGALAGRIIDRWGGGDRAPTLVPVGRDGASTVTWDLERQGPHVVIAGPEAPDVTRGLLAALAVIAAPDELGMVLVGPAATFGSCTALPHVVGNVAHPDSGEADRVVRCLRAELRRRSAAADEDRSRDRLVVVLDEPTARDVPGFAAAVTAVARDGAAHGVHLVVATDRPADAFDDALRSSGVAYLEVASRLGELTTRPRVRSSLHVPGRPPVELDPVTARIPSSQSPAPDAPDVTPFVVGRELTPMERRLVRGRHPDEAPGVAGPLDVLVGAVGRAANETGRFPPRACIPPPLPEVIASTDLLGTHASGVPWAVADLPDEQRHEVRQWSPGAGEGILVTGARGAAASWPIATLVLGLAARSSADEVHAYVITDGGSGAGGGLDELERLSLVGDCVGVDHLDDVAAVISGIADEVTRRREGVTGASTVPAIVLLVDDVGGLRLRLRARADLSGTWDDFERVVRFGGDVGVSVIATARARTDLPADLEARFETRLAVDDTPGAPAGRAVDLADGTVVQLAEPPPSLRHALDEMADATRWATEPGRPPQRYTRGRR